mmetsp:Transcript_27412/g.58904  ORF Transcript_27412/g.58904 Transcript_27412/m.58904 type:complete len:109 (-) Transcript_27412:44-370(-)
MDPLRELPERLERIRDVYEFTTRRGDVIWIPPWMWHRVDYDGGGNGKIEYKLATTTKSTKTTTTSYEELSIGASIFHFYPMQYLTNFPLFSFLIVPNLIQEVLGFNTE